MARKNKVVGGYSGGKEKQMSVLGWIFLFFGIVGAIACFVLSGVVTKTSGYSKWGDDGLSYLRIAFGFVSLFQGIALNIILSAGAEVIRILKKQAGLPFDGKISCPSSEPFYIYKCSICNETVQGLAYKCSKCKRDFET